MVHMKRTVVMIALQYSAPALLYLIIEQTTLHSPPIMYIIGICIHSQYIVLICMQLVYLLILTQIRYIFVSSRRGIFTAILSIAIYILGRFKTPVSSQTHKLMAAIKFSDYLGLNDYKKAKKLKRFIHLRSTNRPQSFVS